LSRTTVPTSGAAATDGGAPRHQQRERALSLLYEAELKGESPLTVLEGLPVRPDAYVCTLLAGVEATREEADSRITAASVGWPLDRMAVIDRLVLRLAVAELLADDGPPMAVVIDEAVELVKTYSTDDSGSFVNGILATIAAEVRPG
jgi:N utilization substance protein B